MPVSNSVETDDLPFPYNIHEGMIGWEALLFHPDRFKADPAATLEVKCGAYLVEPLAHRSACRSATAQGSVSSSTPTLFNRTGNSVAARSRRPAA